MSLRDGRDDAGAGTGDGPRSEAAAERVAAADTVSPADSLLADARAWLEQDPDDATRAELSVLLAEVAAGDPDAVSELAARFGSRLTFGTAGLRGELGAGPNRMNRVLVAQAAAGLAAFLTSREAEPSILIGYDARTNSDVFARDTAELMAGAGVRAVLLPRALPTPVLAFGVRHLGASAGVMVTASHNPPRDNGYKVYLGGVDDGAQIVSPTDAEIQSEILRVAGGDTRDLPRSDGYEVAGDEVVDEYIRRTAALSPAPTVPLTVVYTALHGVGWQTARRVFTAAGFGEPIVVAQQIEPDAAFPTVSFPNPEEPGALDLSFATAAEAGAELILANDPDADRLAVAVPDVAGRWRRLSGNEVGLLLGWRAAERATAAGPDGAGTLACSLVSSPVLGRIAEAHGLGFAETLTGFKWISRAPSLRFGFEEALGYLVDPEKVRDKDGISAAVDLLALAAELKAAGRSVDDRLREAAERFGAYASSQVSLRVSDLAEIPRLMTKLRSAVPDAIGGVPVVRVDDFTDGFDHFPASDLLRFWLDGGSRVILRPSGTEPKLKAYIDAASTDGTAEERMSAAAATVDALERGVRELLA
ncbi:phospho-sugar mutase [Lysobacter korlensis]|uniref:Phospho-sugar mutase n=1 Tax=Lysobacter korlensis TaxID=553636 RepID=A0ABV6RYG2_9GAMM